MVDESKWPQVKDMDADKIFDEAFKKTCCGCSGRGWANLWRTIKCPICKGTGRITP